jgi:uncharacterized membrane protein
VRARASRAIVEAMLSRTLAIVVAAAVALALPWDAAARSGGSFGGGFRSSSRSSGFRSSGSFGSRSFGSSSSRSFGSSSSRSTGSSSWGGSRSSTRYVPVPVPVGSPYGYGPGVYSRPVSSSSVGFGAAVVVLLLLIALIVAVLVLRAVWRRVRAGVAEGAEAATERCDVTLVQLGIQIQARHIQAKLEQLAERTQAQDEAALAFALRTLAGELKEAEAHVEYGAVQQQLQLGFVQAQDQFELWAGNERAKFNREIIRTDASGTRRQQKEWQTDGLRDEDGQLAVHEFFVLSLVLATRGVRLPTQLVDHTVLTGLLDALVAVRTEQLVALEVVWSPAAQSDAMGREDMTSRYPQLAPI